MWAVDRFHGVFVKTDPCMASMRVFIQGKNTQAGSFANTHAAIMQEGIFYAENGLPPE